MIGKKTEYVAIDSSPRGLKVKKYTQKNKTGKIIGETPMFDEDAKNATSKYKIIYSSRGTTKLSPTMKKTETCGVVWNDPIFKDVPLFKEMMTEDKDNLLSKINPLNYIKGGKVDCSIKLNYSPRKRQVDKTNYKGCGNFLIIPPKHKYKEVSERLMEDWIQKNFNEKKNSCDRVIKPNKAKEILTFLGFHHLTNNEYGIEFQMYGKIAQLGYKMDATHLVFLHYDKKGDVFQVKPKIYDIYNFKRERPRLEQSFIRKLNVDDELSFLNKLEDAVKLFPNSVALKVTFNETIHLDSQEAEAKYNTERRKINFPPSIRLANVYYPLQKYGINYSFNPSVTITNWDDTYEVDFYVLAMEFNFYMHTPIGTFTGLLGAGYSYTEFANIESGYEDNKWIPITQWGIEYYYFLNDRYYFNLGYRRNQIRLGEIKEGDFNLKEFSNIFFSVGYYTPELQLKIKNWFN